MFYQLDEQDEMWLSQARQYLNLIPAVGTDSISNMMNVMARIDNIIKKINDFKQKQQDNENKKKELAQKEQEIKQEVLNKNKKEV